MKIKVPQLLWYGNNEIELKFPPSWSIFYCPMKGGERKKLSPDGMEKALLNPLGTKPIRELAKGKKEIVILFDDLARPTPVSEIVPFVIRELEEAGISDRQVRFIAARMS